MKRNHGFTLVELLVVLAIISLLLSIALPRYFASVQRSREVALMENLQVLRSGIDKYYADKGEYPASLGDLVSLHYFRSIPLDPVTESATTWQLLPSADPDKPGVADIRSGAPGKTRDGIAYQSL
jgi:general secretion pathway protein G